MNANIHPTKAEPVKTEEQSGQRTFQQSPFYEYWSLVSGCKLPNMSWDKAEQIATKLFDERRARDSKESE